MSYLFILIVSISIFIFCGQTKSLECYQFLDQCETKCNKTCNIVEDCDDIKRGPGYVCAPSWYKWLACAILSIFLFSLFTCSICLCCPCCLLFKYLKTRKQRGRVIAPPPPNPNGQPNHTVYTIQNYPPPPGYYANVPRAGYQSITGPYSTNLQQPPPTYQQPFAEAKEQAQDIMPVTQT